MCVTDTLQLVWNRVPYDLTQTFRIYTYVNKGEVHVINRSFRVEESEILEDSD